MILHRRMNLRWFISALFLLPLLAILLLPQPLQAQSAIVMPSTPTGVTVQAGSSNALISWTSGGSGVNGACSSDHYYVMVYEMIQSFPVAAESMEIDGTSWYVDELKPATKYFVEVYAESNGNACTDEFSALATTTFWTPSFGAGPSAPATRTLRVPAPVRDLSVVRSTSTGHYTITWKKPVNIGTKRNKRCAYTSAGGNQEQKHNNQTIEYNYTLYNVYTGTDIADVYFRSSAATLSKTVSSGLPQGTGYYLRVEVQAYSFECDQWSKVREFTWWQ